MFESIPESKIGKYQILQLLGEGGMGRVFLGYDYLLERHVAIKCLHTKQTEEKGLRRLKKEARILAKLNSPFIVQLYEFIHQDQQFAIAMEYVKGATLNQYLDSRHFSNTDGLRWLHQLASGISAAHEKGIVHKDLKAENIIVSDEGRIKIMDFGIAGNHGELLTLQGKVSGSFTAMSPEQALGNTVDQRSDLFSLGILAYRIFCARHPFGLIQNPAAIVNKLLYETIVPPENFNTLGPEINQLITKLLEKDPKNRPASAQVIIDITERLLNISTINDKTPTPDSPKEDQTKELNEAINSQEEVRQGRESHPKHFLRNIFFLAVVMGLFSALFWHGQKPFRRLVEGPDKIIFVQSPSINFDGDSETQERIQQNILYALEQTVIQSPGYSLAYQSEDEDLSVSEADEKLQSTFITTGADFILNTIASCNISSCTIKVALIESKSNIIRKQMKWTSFYINDVEMYTIARNQANRLLDVQQPETNLGLDIDGNTYRDYLQVRAQFEVNPTYDIALTQKVEALIDESPKFEPLYQIYTEIMLNRFTETNDTKYIAQLRQKLVIAERLLPPSLTLNKHWLELYFTTEDAAKVKVVINKMKNLGGSQFDLLRAQARSAELENQFDQAMYFYDQAISIQPSLSLLCNLAQVQWLAGESQKARITLERILSLAPLNHFSLFLRASINLSEGRLDEAITDYRILSQNTHDAANYSNLGLVYLLKKDYIQAYDTFQKANVLAPNKIATLLNLADTEYLLGDKNHAQEIYQRIVELYTADPIKSVESRTTAAQAYAQIDKHLDAVKLIQTLLVEDSKNPNVLFSAALVYAILEEPYSTSAFIERAAAAGVGNIWFQLPWFEPLCAKTEYRHLVENLPLPNLCL